MSGLEECKQMAKDKSADLICSSCGKVLHPPEGIRKLFDSCWNRHFFSSFTLIMAVFCFVFMAVIQWWEICWAGMFFMVSSGVAFLVELYFNPPVAVCPRCRGKNTLVLLNSPEGQEVQTKIEGWQHAADDMVYKSVAVPSPQRICTKCGASIVLGKPTGQMSCISIIATVAFVVTLLLMIWACIHDISAGIGLSGIPFFWPLFILFISGAIALSGYIESQTINDSDCPECCGENTLIDINSPMGQKILAETENGRMSSVENQSNEDKGLPRSSGKMNDSMRSSVEEYGMDVGVVQAESSTNVVSFCTECGAVRKQREKFCGRCGHKF